MQRKVRLTPSFKGLRPATRLASSIKKRNRAENTKPEILLRRELWKTGLRYRKNNRQITGSPDIAFWRRKIALFCDGDFWHGRNWPVLKRKLSNGHNAEYWCTKIQRNIERDKSVNTLLQNEGWLVIRVWEKDIISNTRAVVSLILAIIDHRKYETNYDHTSLHFLDLSESRGVLR
jgi:DNA mismatch endonuclease (patch repair protein)